MFHVTVIGENGEILKSGLAIGNRDALMDAEYAKHEFCVVSAIRVK